MKTLLIDDYSAQIELVHHVLSVASHSVRSAEAARQAFTTIKQNQ